MSSLILPLTQCFSGLALPYCELLYPLSVVGQSRQLLHSRDLAFEDAHEYLISFLDLFCESAFQVELNHTVRCIMCSQLFSKVESNGEIQLVVSPGSISTRLETFHEEQDIGDYRSCNCL